MNKEKKEIIGSFLKYLRPYWDKEVGLFFLILLNNAGSLASPYILKILIDQVFPKHDLNLLIRVLEILIAIYVFRILSSILSDYLYSWISNNIVKDIRIDLFVHLIKMPLAFFNENKSGEIIYKVNNEVDKIQSVLTNSLIRFFNNFFTIVGLIVMLSLLNLKLFLISAMIFPFVFINVRYFSPQIRKSYERVSKKEGDLLNYFGEKFSNIKLIKNFNTYQYEGLRLTAKVNDLIGTNLHVALIASLSRNFSVFLVALGPILVFWWGGHDVLINTMSLGALVAFLQYLNKLYGPSTDLMSLHTDLVRSFVSMENVFRLYENKFDFKEEASLMQPLVEIKQVEFKNITFKHDNRIILSSVNLQLEAGKKYAFVGESGCGKTSLVNLLCKFYSPDNGQVLLNNSINLKSIDLITWMDNISIVSQENQIFNGSIMDNLKYGTFEEEDEQIIKLTKLMGIHDHIMELEGEYNWVIGDNGAKFSGGQKQIVAIIRAMLKKSEILILDEATSALDSIKEELIFRVISKIKTKKIVILISHRISTIKDVDVIFCLKGGMIVETGSHEQLLVQKGYYYRLFKNQLAEYQTTANN